MNPALASTLACAGWQQHRAQFVAGAQTGEHVGLATVGDERRAARTGGESRGFEFADHASGAQIATQFCTAVERTVVGLGHADKTGVTVADGVFVVQSSAVGQNNQHLRRSQIGGEGSQNIVVAQTNFVGSNGIVFIEHRHDTHRQQSVDRGAHIQITGAVVEVLVRQQQ